MLYMEIKNFYDYEFQSSTSFIFAHAMKEKQM